MGRKSENINIRKVVFTYAGTENDLNQFLKAIIRDHLVKNNFISGKLLKNVKSQ